MNESGKNENIKKLGQIAQDAYWTLKLKYVFIIMAAVLLVIGAYEYFSNKRQFLAILEFAFAFAVYIHLKNSRLELLTYRSIMELKQELEDVKENSCNLDEIEKDLKEFENNLLNERTP